jgi:APA family basic amino acid/polyamine antiporter
MTGEHQDQTQSKVITSVSSEKALGIAACTALVVGNMIGSGIFLLPSSLAPYGGMSIGGWLLTSAGAIVLALLFARLAQLVPKAGGPYAYTRAGFGDFAGFWIAWGYWIAIWSGNAAIAVALVSYLAAFIPALTKPQLAGIVAIGAVWLVTWINLRGVKSAGVVQTITTIIKIIPLLAIAAIGLFYVDWKNFVPLNPTGKPWFVALISAATLTLWSFLGLESATVPAGDVENPESTIPRATVMGTLIAALIYVFSTIVVIGVIPSSTLAQSTAPFADAAKSMWGNWAFYLIAVGAIVSCFGALNGWTLLQGQVPMAAALDKQFPRRFTKISKAGVPAFGVILSSILITIMLLFNASGSKNLVAIFNFIILLATLTTLVPYAFCSIAELVILFTEPRSFNGQRMGAAAILGILGFIYSVFTIIGSGAEIVLWGFVLLILGLPVWAIMRRQSI